MRVALASPFTTHHGASPACHRVARVARELADRGHDVTWLCTQWWGGDHDRFEENGITYRRVTAGPTLGRYAAALPLAVRRAAPDVVHATNSPPSAAVAAGIGGTLARSPVVVDWWDRRPEDSTALSRRAVRGADAVITPSRTVKTSVRELGAGGDDVRVIPESVDAELVANAPVDDRFDIVYSRRLDRHANVETFLLGLAELRTRDWRAAVLGDGPERAAAERTAADLRIDDRVTFLGDRPTPENVSVLKGSHVAVQTATRETFATDLLWALACGCVGLVEYQADSSAHELVEGRNRCELVTSPQELAAAIVDADDIEPRSVDEDFTEFDHDAVLERYLDCYRSVGGVGADT